MKTPTNMTAKASTPLTIHLLRRLIAKYSRAGVWPFPLNIAND